MQQNISEVEAVGIGVPKKVVEEIGDVLDRTVMAGKRLQEKIMAEALQDQEWAFDERIFQREILVIPNPLPGQAASPDQKADDKKGCIPQPIRPEITGQSSSPRTPSLGGSGCWVWVLSVHTERM